MLLGPRNLNKVSTNKRNGKGLLVDEDGGYEDEGDEEEDEIGLHETTVILDEDEDDDHFDPKA